MKNKIWMVILFVLFFGVFIVHINEFVFLKNSAYSDIPITHYPNLLTIQRSIINHYQIPLWSNHIYSGTPFAANPLSGLWYFPGWLAVLLPLPLGINLAVLVHLVFGVWGFYNLLRLHGRSYEAAIFGAFSFFVGVKMISHYGAGHLTLIYAISWTPWLVYFTKFSSNFSKWKEFFFPGICLGMIISADPRWVIPSGLLWVIYLINVVKEKNDLSIKSFFSLLKRILSAIFIGLALSAAVWIPLIEFVKFSSRSTMSIAENLNYSLELEKLFGLLFPDFGGFSEWVIYPSMIVLFLSVFVLFLHKENKAERIWFFIFLAGFLLSLGSALPLISFLFRLPVINLLRVPARFFFICLFSLSVLASFGFDYLISGVRAYKFDRLFFLTPIIAFVTIFFVGFSILTQDIKLNFLWSLIFASLSFLVIGLAIHSKIPSQLLIVFLFLVLFVDVMGVNFFSLEFRSKMSLLNKSSRIYEVLRDNTPYRIYSPSYAITQEEAAYWGIRQINGIDPMQLTSYVSYFKKASNVPYSGYSVTLPPFVDGDPAEVNKDYCPDVDLLKKLAVQYVISNFSMEQCLDIKKKGVVGDRFVYELKPVWAWQKTDQEMIAVDDSDIIILKYSPNKIKFNVQRQGELTVSEIFYPGWKVFINGEEEIIKQDDIFRSFYLPKTNNEVEMVFRPVSVMVGIGIEVVSWILSIVIWLQHRKQTFRIFQKL